MCGSVMRKGTVMWCTTVKGKEREECVGLVGGVGGGHDAPLGPVSTTKVEVEEGSNGHTSCPCPACLMQVTIQNVHKDYAEACGNEPGDNTVLVNATLQAGLAAMLPSPSPYPSPYPSPSTH